MRKLLCGAAVLCILTIGNAASAQNAATQIGDRLGYECGVKQRPFLRGPVLRDRLAGYYQEATKGHLTSAERAPAEAKPLLVEYASVLRQCFKDRDAALAEVQPRALQYTGRADAEWLAVIAALGDGELTFGEANRRLHEIFTSFRMNLLRAGEPAR